MEGIPLYVWEKLTAADLLRPFCSVEGIDPETRNRRNLAIFKLTAWTTRPEFISETRTLQVPELFDDSSFQIMRRPLSYSVQIRVRRLLVRYPSDSPPQSLPPTPPSSCSSDEEDSKNEAK